IEVYTTSDNVNLVDIFHAMDKGGDSLPDTKDNTAIKKYFEKVYAEIDFERVYSSDLKKMIKWYEVLKKNNIDIKLSEPEPEPEPEEEIIPEKKPEPAKTTEKKEASKPATVKKAAKKKTEEKAGPSKSSTPAKKAAKKKGK
ncbi:MAG TPA: hypothetical protein VK588_12795, partial [Chitinophagaceae bacterium]|nr:hypothetical protein [Chitinophagaceae bacterium]